MYKINYNNFKISSDGILITSPILMYDKKAEGNKIYAKKYFDNAYKIFTNRLEKLNKSKITASEEKELKFMLDALLSAKNIIEK